MTKTMISNLPDQGSVTVSFGAGRVILALLISPSGVMDRKELPPLAGVLGKRIPMVMDELNDIVALFPSPEVVDEASTQVILPYSDNQGNYLEATVLDACRSADKEKSKKSQAVALVSAWRFLYPKVNEKQELQEYKVKEWLKIAAEAGYTGREATTVFGWMQGVSEGLLEKKDFPLAYINKVIQIKAAEPQTEDPEGESEGEQDVMEVWRGVARKMIDQGANKDDGKKFKNHLGRIASAVGGGPKEP